MHFAKKTDKNGLNILIVGCGKVGTTLVEQLCNEGHDITVVDTEASRVQALAELYDVMGIVGNGASYSIQMDAGIKDADLIIAVTGSDELNLLCCTIARKVGECAAIARVRNPDYIEDISYLREKLGLTMVINPELEMAKEAARILALPTALEVSSFAHGQAEIIKFKLPGRNILDGIKIAELGRIITHKNNGVNILIGAIERDGEVYIPDGEFKVKQDDVVSVVLPRRYVKEFFEYIGLKTNKVKDTMIVGGGRAGYYLAKQLLNMGVDVKIIEQNRNRCEELSVLLPDAVIINGDGTDEELLKEEGLKYVQSFVPLTGIDEENILLTLHARHASDAKVITKINRINFKTVINSLDLGSVLYPKYITAEAIIAYVRAKKNSMDSNIETLYHLFDQRVEAIEFRIDEKSAVTDIPLRDLKLKKDLLISFINRNGKIMLPNGQDSIKVGDTVMIMTTHKGFRDIKDILL